MITISIPFGRNSFLKRVQESPYTYTWLAINNKIIYHIDPHFIGDTQTQPINRYHTYEIKEASEEEIKPHLLELL